MNRDHGSRTEADAGRHARAHAPDVDGPDPSDADEWTRRTPTTKTLDELAEDLRRAQRGIA